VPITTLYTFEGYVEGIINQHINLVPPGLGSKAELKEEILDGMKTTWELLSPQFQHDW
jgi:hypothetical protein